MPAIDNEDTGAHLDPGRGILPRWTGNRCTCEAGDRLGSRLCGSPWQPAPRPLRRPGMFSRAEQLRAEGRVDAALRMTDRVIARGSHSPTRELVALHTTLLREQGRLVDARSYEDFAARYYAGERTERVDEELSRRDCGERQAGLRLIHSWAKPKQGFWAIGVIGATFEIDRQGSIGRIIMHSARDPASAWAAIDSIARAKVHSRRVAALYAEDPSRFPIALCLWRDFDPRNDPIPRDGTIRGGR